MRAIWSCEFVAARKDRSICDPSYDSITLTPLSALSRLDNRTSLMPPTCSGVVSRLKWSSEAAALFHGRRRSLYWMLGSCFSSSVSKRMMVLKTSQRSK